MIDADHTAIGDGLGVALTRLEQAGREEGNHRKGAFVVLLTDGSNNSGVLTPGAGRGHRAGPRHPGLHHRRGQGWLHLPAGAGRAAARPITYTQIMADLDENALISISEPTGGRFFRARDADTIESAFKSIDQRPEDRVRGQILPAHDRAFPVVRRARASAGLLAPGSSWPGRPCGSAPPRPPARSSAGRSAPS